MIDTRPCHLTVCSFRERRSASRKSGVRSGANYERKKTVDGLTLRIYRGEGAALLAFDLERAKATDDFVGFSVEVRYPGSNNWGALRNRLHFDYPPNPERPLSFKSTEAPIQKFRWVHVPTDVPASASFATA